MEELDADVGKGVAVEVEDVDATAAYVGVQPPPAENPQTGAPKTTPH